MRVSKFSLPAIFVGFVLTFLLTGSLSAKERGWYFHGGLSYWNDAHRWANESFFSSRSLPGFSTTGWSRDGSASQLSFGIGYNINKNWAIEVFNMGLPDLTLSGTHWLIPPIEPDDEAVSASWVASRTEGNFLSLSVIYDHYLSERVSLFLKVGVGWSGQHRQLESTLTGSHRELLDEQLPYPSGVRSRDSQETDFFAVGIRMPLFQYSKGSITFAYQFLRKSVWEWDEERIPPQWIRQSGKVKASTFEVGVQLSL
ncbi:MAG: hypothetical protein F4X56_03085 [Gammaproteobacteria bacterium]|nr:hypothetical protein [Gammaproteobacteria bacterium]MYC24887.1 hypothetical protein [Gammaproteobacteria bacterium]